MILKEMQFLFTRLQPRLIDRAHFLGFEVCGGEWHRPQEMCDIYVERGTGIADSNHKRCIAWDMNLFKKNGDAWEWCVRVEDYRPLGLWWEQQHELCRWGGDFGDGYHFSLLYAGIV